MDVTGILVSATDSLFYILFFGIMIVITFFMLNWMSFKHHIRIREYGANGTMSVFDDRAKEVKDKSGNIMLLLRKKRERIPMPPKEAVDINQKGKWVIEAYRMSSGVYVYGNTVQEPKDIKEKHQGDVVDVFTPLSDTKKIHWLNQIEQAKQDEGLDKEKLLMTFGALAFVLIIVGMVFIMWGDIMQPTIDMAVEMKEITQTQAEITRMLQEVIQDKQTFAATTGNTPVVPPN